MCLIILCYFWGLLIISRYIDILSTYALKKGSISILINSNWKVNQIQCENTGSKTWINKKSRLMKVAYLHQFQKQLRISDFVKHI